MQFSAVWSRSILFTIPSKQYYQGLQCLQFSAIWLGSILFAFLSDQGLQILPCSAVWSGSSLFVILSKQYYQALHCLPFLAVWSGLHYLPFSAVWSRSMSTQWFTGTVWSGSTLFAFLHSSLISIYTVCHSFLALLSRYRLFAILSSLIRVYTICHSQQSVQGLHYLTFSAVWSRSRSTLSFSGTVWSGSTLCHSQKSDLHLHCLPFSAAWTTSTLFATLGSPIRVYTVCHSQQSDQGLHYLPFSLSSIIKVYTVCHSQQCDQGYTTRLSQPSNQGQGLQCHFQKWSDQGLTFLPFSAVWSGSTLFAIVSSLIRV